MYLFELASRHMTWLAERQAVTAANIANADTPGYRARDVNAFSAILDDPSMQFAVTSPGHIGLAEGQFQDAGRTTGDSWASGHSGNNVSLEQELMKASSGNRMMTLDAGLARAFQRMLLASVKA